MRQFPTVLMRGGTSKGLIFLEEDLPAREEWDNIFVQCMGSPDPKQIDGVGGCVSSNNKIVVVSKSTKPGIDVEYLVGQSIVGRTMIDYKSNCGNMTAAVAPFAIEMGLVSSLTEPVTTVHLFNRNTDAYIDVEVPVKNGRFDNEGSCSIAGVDGTAGELKVNFLHPAGSKTGKLFPTGQAKERLEFPGGAIEATILDVSNPIVLVRAADLGLIGGELPSEVDGSRELSELLEKIRGSACVRLGLADSLEDAAVGSPGAPKVGFVAPPQRFTDLIGREIRQEDMDLCTRVISVFKCHKACPLTAASAISVAAQITGTLVSEFCTPIQAGQVRVGHPSGVMTVYPRLKDSAGALDDIEVSGVAVQRTARRIMDGTIYIHT